MKINYSNILLATVTTLSLTACGEGDGQSQNPQADSQPTIQTKLAKAQLGVLSGATVKIYELGVTPYKHLYTETTSTGDSIEKIGNFDSHYTSLESEKFYLYTVSKGLDMDADDDGIIDEYPTINKGSFHAIIKGKSAKAVNGDFKVTTASELLYKKVRDDINDTVNIEEKLTASAKEIFQKVTDNDTEITSDDILQYNPVEHKKIFKEEYQEQLAQIIKDIHEDKKEELINQAPVANAGRDKSLMKNTSTELSASGLDMDGNIISYEWSENGYVLSDEKKFTYTPNTVGTHTLTLHLKDNDGAEASDRVNITVVEKQNTLPQVNSTMYTIDEDTEKKIRLEAKDKDGDTLTYKVLRKPIYGMLIGKAPNLLYKPDSNYNGKDSFIFVANDGKSDSKKAIITIHVKKVNDKPVIVNDGGTLTTKEDTSKRFTLKAEDTENDKLTYIVVKKPAHGKLIYQKTNFIYTPNANYNGTDSFIIKANDGQKDSNDETIMINITPVNDAPIVDAGDTVSTITETATILKADARDIDGEIKSYNWFEGTKVLATTKIFNYIPRTIGSHTISVTVADNQGLTATDRIVVTATEQPNEKPIAQNQTLSMDEDTTKSILLKANDDEGDRLTYKIVTQPKNGTLRGKAPSVRYAPKKDFNGADSFTFRASDGKDDSNIAKVSLLIKDVIEADTVKPVITLKGESTVTVVQGEKYTERGATAKDTRDGTVAIKTTGIVSTSKIGTYMITYTATDKAGNKATKTRTVQVIPLHSNDTIAPVIKYSYIDKEDTQYYYIGWDKIFQSIILPASAIDNKDGELPVKITGHVNSKQDGTYKITYTAVDKSGNKSIRIRKFIVDTKPPVITINGKKNLVLRQGEIYHDESASATDNEAKNVRIRIQSIKYNGKETSPFLLLERESRLFKAGVYTIKYRAFDHTGNHADTIRTITVYDKMAPKISLKGEATITLTQGQQYTESGAMARDETDGSMQVHISSNLNINKAGIYTITYIATDKAGNKGSKTRTVKVLAPTYKVVTSVVGNKLTVRWSGFPNGYHRLQYSRPTSNHSYTVKGLNGEKEFPLDRADYKTYHYTFKMYDTRDLNKKEVYTKEFDLKPLKIDKTTPVITLSGDSLITLYIGEKYVERGTNSYTTTGDKRTYLSSDRVDGSVKVIIKGEVDNSKIGTYIITYTATDKAGNKATKTRTVKVIRSSAPVITLKGESTITMYQGEQLNYQDITATATDDRDGTVRVTTSGYVDTSKAGTYIYTYTAVDREGNKARKTRTVHVLKSEYKVSYSFDQQNIIINWDSFPRAFCHIEVAYKESHGRSRSSTAYTYSKVTGSKSIHLYAHNVDAILTVYDRTKAVISTQKIKIPSEESLSPLPKITFSGKSGEDAIDIKVGDTIHHPKPTAYSTKYGAIPVKIVRFSQIYTNREFSIQNTFVVTSNMAESGGILIVHYEATDKDGNTAKAYVVYHVGKKVIIKADTKKPVITIKGDFKSKDPQGHLLNFYPRQVITGSYHEDGADAIDDKDGKVAVRISYGKLTKSLFRAGKPASGQGIYVVFYTAKDKAGNKTVKYKLVLKNLAAWYPSMDYEVEVGKYIKAHFNEF